MKLEFLTFYESQTMSIVRVKTKYQVTLPTAVRERAGVNIGDVLEATVEKGKITLTPKATVDRELLMSLADTKAGRVHGPFNSVDEMLRSLGQKTAKKRKAPQIALFLDEALLHKAFSRGVQRAFCQAGAAACGKPPSSFSQSQEIR